VPFKLYPDRGLGLPLRLVGDGLVLTWTALWVLAGIAVYHAVEALQAVADAIRGTGANFNQLIAALTGTVPRGIPGLSDFLVAQLAALKRISGDQLIGTGNQIHDGIDRLAIALALVIALPPIATVLAAYGVWRWRDAREMGAADAFVRAAVRSGRVQQARAALALRAVSSLSFTQLMRASDDPVGDLDERRYDRLADAMLRRAGLRPSALAHAAAPRIGHHREEQHRQRAHPDE
jgi:hypothetical protein